MSVGFWLGKEAPHANYSLVASKRHSSNYGVPFHWPRHRRNERVCSLQTSKRNSVQTMHCWSHQNALPSCIRSSECRPTNRTGSRPRAPNTGWWQHSPAKIRERRVGYRSAGRQRRRWVLRSLSPSSHADLHLWCCCSGWTTPTPQLTSVQSVLAK